jgi:hypothetical protein
MFASSSMMEVMLSRSLRYFGRCCKNWDMRSNRGITGPVWHVQVYNFTPKLLRGIFEVEKIHAVIVPRCTFYTRIGYVLSSTVHRCGYSRQPTSSCTVLDPLGTQVVCQPVPLLGRGGEDVLGEPSSYIFKF